MTEHYRLSFAINAIARVEPSKITILVCGGHVAEFRRDTYYVSGCKQIFKPESELTNFTDWQEFNAQLDQRYQLSCLQKFTPKWVKRDKADDTWFVSLCNQGSGVEVWSYSCQKSQRPRLGETVIFDGGVIAVRQINEETAVQRMVIYGECTENDSKAA